MSPTAASATARLFVALWPPAALQHELALWRDGWLGRAGAPVAAEKIHLTLHFLGATPVEHIAALQARLPRGGSPFAMRFGRVELWHGLAVLRPFDDPAPLLQLQAAIAEVLRDLALPVEARRFKPHLTVARKLPPRLPQAPPIDVAWTAADPVLVRSAGGRYDVLPALA